MWHSFAVFPAAGDCDVVFVRGMTIDKHFESSTRSTLLGLPCSNPIAIHRRR